MSTVFSPLHRVVLLLCFTLVLARSPRTPATPVQRCAELSTQRPVQGGGFHTSYDSLLAFARQRRPHEAGFPCLPRDCDALSAADATLGLLPESRMCTAPLTRRRVECGPSLAGWRDVAIVMQVPAAPHSLASMLRAQLGRSHRSGGTDDDDEGVLACLPGVWWADKALAAAPLFLVQDCVTPPCGAPPRDVTALRVLGVNVTFSWFDCSHDSAPFCGSLWAKVMLLLRAAAAGAPTAHYVLKVDADTMLFPARMLAFLRTRSVAAGAHQPLYFGTHSGANASSFQGHAYGINGETLRRLVAIRGNATTLADGDLEWNVPEDAQLGAAAGRVGAQFVHCGHFIDYAPAYVKPAGALVYPLPTRPITLHKTAKLSRWRKRQLPSGLCVGLPWNCRNESDSTLRLRLLQLIG